VSVAVVRGGKTVYAKGFGLREVGKTDQVDPDTVFQVASLSKSISSTCVSAAVSKDLVKWSDRVTTYLPDFRLSDPQVTDQLTIADLFSHRSGLPATAGDDLESFGFDRATMVTRAGGELSVTIGPKKLKAPLTHYHGDTFSWLAPGGNGDPVSAVTFTGGGDRAQTLEIELLQIPKLERKD
jgi:CubicO group peptidase (beta-lactamase class C family)